MFLKLKNRKKQNGRKVENTVPVKEKNTNAETISSLETDIAVNEAEIDGPNHATAVTGHEINAKSTSPKFSQNTTTKKDKSTLDKTQTLVDLEEAIELLEDRTEDNSATSNIKEDNDAFDAELDALMQDFEDKNTEELNGDGNQSKSMDTNSSDTKKIANAETDVSQTQNNTVDKLSVKSGVDDSEDAIEAEFASLMEQVDKVEDERVLDKSKSTTKQQSEENENQTSNSSKNTHATSTQNQIDEPERIPTEQRLYRFKRRSKE